MSTPDDRIRPIEWVPASSVHPNEAHDFTPWLARNLSLVAAVLGLDELELKGTEVAVGDYRLDLLADGQLGEEQWPVAIENQYGTTDHRHLGQLVTYLAQQEQGHAVWIVEEASDQHIAAIDFLNRTTVADFNYWLLRARFTPTGEGYQVYFDVLSRPNEFIKSSESAHGGAGRSPRQTKTERYEFHAALLEHIREPLTKAGWRNVAMNKSGYLLRMRYPTHQPLSQWGFVFVRSLPDQYYVHFMVRNGDAATNTAIIDVLQQRYGVRFEAAMPPDAEVRWHDAEQNADAIKVVFRGAGYGTDPAEAAERVVTVTGGWLELLESDPIGDLDSLVAELVEEEA